MACADVNDMFGLTHILLFSSAVYLVSKRLVSIYPSTVKCFLPDKKLICLGLTFNWQMPVRNLSIGRWDKENIGSHLSENQKCFAFPNVFCIIHKATCHTLQHTCASMCKWHHGQSFPLESLGHCTVMEERERERKRGFPSLCLYKMAWLSRAFFTPSSRLT